MADTLAQFQQINHDRAKKLCAEAIAKVEANADPAYKDLAYGVGCMLALNMPVLTSNDIDDYIQKYHPKIDARCTNKKVLGYTLVTMAKMGILNGSDHKFVSSGRGRNHSRPLRQWKSLACKEIACG